MKNRDVEIKREQLRIIKSGLRLNCPQEIVFKDKKKYSRKEKHKNKD